MNPLIIGKIKSVSGYSAEVMLRDDLKGMYLTHKGRLYSIGQIGSYLVIPVAHEKIVGIVSEIKMLTVQNESGEQIIKSDKKVISLQLVGSISNNKFERGIGTYPLVEDDVCLADENDFKIIFEGQERGKNIEIGLFSQNEKFKVLINVDNFFSKHVAVLGTTGSGKSCAVAKILQKVLEFKDSHLILLDLHGEYVKAFPNKSNIITGSELEIPYWLLDYDELQDLCIDKSESAAHNQTMIFKEAILKAKRDSIGKDGLGLEEIFTIDTPIYFDLNEVHDFIKNKNEEMVPGARAEKEKQGSFYGQFTRFLTRLESKINDQRFAFMFKPKKYTKSEHLESFMRLLLGRNQDEYKNITVIDLSGIPFEIVEIVVSVLSRLIFDFNFWNKQKRECPLCIVYEEAHNYIPRNRSSIAKMSVERIAKEGRKYGVSLIVVSQRPSELSETVLSQCNNFISLRVTNPDDQNYVKKLVPDQNAELMNMLSILRRGEALIIGEAVVMPVRVLMDLPSPTPDSDDIKFFDKWNNGIKDLNIGEIIDSWRKQER